MTAGLPYNILPINYYTLFMNIQGLCALILFYIVWNLNYSGQIIYHIHTYVLYKNKSSISDHRTLIYLGDYCVKVEVGRKFSILFQRFYDNKARYLHLHKRSYYNKNLI